MHLGRFHYVAWLFKKYFESNTLLAIVDQVIAQLQAYIAAPTAENSTAFRIKVDLVLAACSKMPAGHNAASFKHIISDTGGDKYVGSGLEQSLREILEKQSMTPADMLVSLQKFRTQFGAYVAAITEIADQLDGLGVEYEELAPDEFEFGAMFPKELVGKSIVDIQGELEHLNRLFKTLNEMMGKGATSPNIRNISSSWWQFFLELDAQQIAAITFAIERVVALHKSNLEILKLKRDATNSNLGQDVVDLIDKKIQEKLKAGMVGIAKEVRAQFQNNQDVGRLNELETQLRMELVHMAQRINQGSAYEIRAGLSVKPKDLTKEESVDEQLVAKKQEAMEVYEKKVQQVQEINDAGLRLASAIEDISGETQLLTDYAKLTEAVQEKQSAPLKK